MMRVVFLCCFYPKVTGKCIKPSVIILRPCSVHFIFLDAGF